MLLDALSQPMARISVSLSRPILAESGPSSYRSFRPKADLSEGSFRPLEIFFLKTKFPPAGHELAGDGTQGPVGTASCLVALEEDRYAQCV